MEKTTIIHISDIHFEYNEPENQGLIINSKIKRNGKNYNNTYLRYTF